MKLFRNNTVTLIVIAIVVFGLIFGVVTLTQNWGKNKDVVNTEASKKKLNQMYGRLNVNSLAPKKDPAAFGDESEQSAVLPDISEYPFVVNPITDNFITVYASADKAGYGNNGWLTEAAEAFNASGPTAGGAAVSVGVRAVPSSLGADFISSGKYTPDVYAPSSDFYGETLVTKGVGVRLIEPYTANNATGLIISNKKYEELSQNGNIPLAGVVVDAVINGNLAIGYTNPLSTEDGLNFLMTILYAFDKNDPLSEQSVSQLKKFQDNIPYLSTDAAMLKDSAMSGFLDGYVGNYQAYASAPELKSEFVFIPLSYRNTNPLYEIGDISDLKKEAASKFGKFLKSPEQQAAATAKGLNGPEPDFSATMSVPDGATLLQAQDIWKKEKSGSSDLTAVFVADISGSMEGSPLLKLKASLYRAASFIDSNTNVGFVTFSDYVNIALPIAKFDNNHRSFFTGAVRSMSAGGGTAMYDAIIVAQKMLMEAQEKNPNTKLMLFVLTDGETNRGYKFNEIEGVTKGLKIPVYTIGYNANIDELQKVSNINEAVTMNADTDDVIYKLQSMFNAQM